MRVNILDLLSKLNDAQMILSPKLGKHQLQVAYLACRMAHNMGWKQEQCNQIFIAGMLHDIGALSLADKLDILELDEAKISNINAHAFRGAWLLEKFFPDRSISAIVKYHHIPWENGDALKKHEAMPEASNLLYLADRVSASISHDSFILTQVGTIKDKIRVQSGSRFKEEYVDAFEKTAGCEAVWLDMMSSDIYKRVDLAYFAGYTMDIDELVNFSHIYSFLIDFRSRFTATHSARVAKTAEALAVLLNFSAEDTKKMLIAGYLHDLGKLAIDNRILEKDSGLTNEEFSIIKSHSYYTYYLLDGVESLGEIRAWAAFHHEKMDGTGYPFHLSSDILSLGSRIMCIADVFAALKESRPYKAEMTKEQILPIMQKMADSGSLDGKMVALVKEQYDLLAEACMKAGEEAEKEYEAFYRISEM